MGGPGRTLDPEKWEGYTPIREILLDGSEGDIIRALCHQCNSELKKLEKTYMIRHR